LLSASKGPQAPFPTRPRKKEGRERKSAPLTGKAKEKGELGSTPARGPDDGGKKEKKRGKGRRRPSASGGGKSRRRVGRHCRREGGKKEKRGTGHDIPLPSGGAKLPFFFFRGGEEALYAQFVIGEGKKKKKGKGGGHKSPGVEERGNHI